MKIHNHPQKSEYLTPAEFPICPEAQGHWMINGKMCHVHLQAQAPIYGIFKPGDRVDVQFKITTFNAGVHVKNLYFGFQKDTPTQNVVFDDTGTNVKPPMDGEDSIAKEWKGHFTSIVPSNMFGWWFVSLNADIKYDDGVNATLECLTPIWVDNISSSGDPLNYHIPVISSRFRIVSVTHPELFYGEQTVEISDLVPIIPISAPWVVRPATYNYGGPAISAMSEARVDLDLHHDIPGTILWSFNQVPDLTGVSLKYDSTLVPGLHKYAIIRTTSFDPDMFAVLLVQGITVDPTVPPVPYGGDVITPPTTPPPTPTDVAFVPNFFETPDHKFKIINLATGTTKIIP